MAVRVIARDFIAAPVNDNVGTIIVSHDTEHHHTAEEERQIRDAALDETIEASFPASDPPSSTPNPDDHTAVARNRRRESEDRAHVRSSAFPSS